MGEQEQEQEQKFFQEERRTGIEIPQPQPARFQNDSNDDDDNDALMIRFVYEMHTSHSTNTAIKRGAYDSEQALAVYAEQHQQQQQQQQQIIHLRENGSFSTANVVTPPIPPKTIIGVDFGSEKREEKRMHTYSYR